MIKLTIRPQVKRKNRFSVFLEDEYLFSISQYTYRKLGEPATVETESVEAFQNECLFPEQYNYCLDLLSRRSYSTKEIREKLTARGVKEELCEELISRLSDAKLLCDEAFKESFLRSRQTYHKQGFYKIRQELSRKGVELSKDDYDEVAERQNLTQHIQKLQSRGVEPKKIISRLMAKGFRYGDIRSVMGGLSRNDIDDEEFDYES